MKKTMMLLLTFILFTLVGCTTPAAKLPDLKADDKVEMTAEEKKEFLLSVVDLTFEDTNNFRLDTFLDLEFAATSETAFNTEGLSTKSDTTVTFDADFDMTNYIEVGDRLENTYVYSKFNRFELDMLNDVYLSTTFGGNTTIVDTAESVKLSLTDTFFLAKNDYAYYHLNGAGSVEVKADNKVVESQSQSKTFTDLKEKTLENRITQDMYDELMASMLELQTMLKVEQDLEMTEAEKEASLQMIDSYVNIFSSGTTHTVQIVVSTPKINELIDNLFDKLEDELSEVADLESFNTVKASIKTAFKAFNFDFRIILEGELEGEKRLSKIEMLITGTFSGFTMDQAIFGESSMPIVLELTIKLNKLGFTLDFDADTLQLPTTDYLETFILVETPSFGDIFKGSL